MKIFLSVLVLAGAIFAVEPRPEYQLDLKVRQVGEGLLNGASRDVYRMFVPVFRQEIPFFRFDSAVRAWRQGRRPVRASSRVIDTRGLAGYASTYVYFENQRDYEYLYQSWVYTDSGWELAWISNILNQSFQYGRSETLAMREVARVALEFALSAEGRRWIKLGRVNLPETLVALRHSRVEESLMVIQGHTVVWRSPEEVKKNREFTGMPLMCEFGMVRVFGSVALVVIDFKNWPHYQGRRVLSRPRGMEIYLKKESGAWRVNSVGKRW